MDVFFRGLIADDEIDICRTVARYLTEKGVDSVYALDGAQALKLYERERFDVVLTDLRMPKMHGHALVNEILKRNPDQLIAVMTGIEEAQLVHDLLARGVRLVITKPFALDFLAANILGILEHQQAQKKSREKSLVEARGEVASEIKNVTISLQEQLTAIQQHFRGTIQEIEEQQIDMERDYIGSVRIMVELMESVNKDSSSHASRVEEFAKRIGEQVGLSGLEARDLSLAALMHDIGKFSMPEEIMNKRPDLLSPQEFVSYRKHPIIGGMLAASVPGLNAVGAMIENHHENFDGSGFPERKKGADLPVSHRILRLADGLDRFLESYGETYVTDWAVGKNHLMENAGKLYDRTLARHAVRALAEMAQERDSFTIVDLKLSELKPGMKLAMDIMHEGVFLLRRNARLTPRSLERLQMELVSGDNSGKISVYLPKEQAAFQKDLTNLT